MKIGLDGLDHQIFKGIKYAVDATCSGGILFYKLKLHIQKPHNIHLDVN